MYKATGGVSNIRIITERRREKTGLRGFRPGPTQTRLYNHTKSQCRSGSV